MSRSIRITLVIGALSAAVVALPVQAQLHGDWPSETSWSATADHAAAHAERVSAHASPTSLNVPRGDLRRDVSEASRSLPPHRSQ